MAKTQAEKKPLSSEHLDALETGRRESRAVKAYMDALESIRPKKRGRKRTADTVQAQITDVEKALVDATSVERLLLLQRRVDLTSELEALDNKVDIGPLEDAFVDVAAGYSARKGVSYHVWREAGVSPAVLKRAGINRGA